MEHWCLKEAYAKAVGCGLAVDFRALGFCTDETNSLRLELNGRWLPDWAFRTYWPQPTHCLAVAVSVPPGQPSGFRVSEVVPGETAEFPKLVADL